MSADGGSSSQQQQQPPAAPDKSQSAKPVSTFSSFINKNTSGKKFAPKAARRRPGAAAPAPAPAPAPKPTESESTPAPPEPETDCEPPIAIHTEPSIEPQLPTPAPTQDAPPHDAAPAEPSISLALLASAETNTTTPSHSAPSASATVHSTLVPPTAVESQQEEDLDSYRPRPAEEGKASSGPAKRQRVELSTAEIALSSPGPTSTTQDETTTTQSAPTGSPSVNASQTEPVDTVHQPPSVSIQEGNDVENQVASTQPPTQSRRRRRLPWVAVNQLQDNEEGSATPTKKPRQPIKPRGKQRAGAVVDDAANGDESDSQPARTRPSAKARGKRRLNETDAVEHDDGDVDAALPVKKPRKPRKDKGKKRTKATAEGDAGVTQEGEGGPTDESAPRKRKGRKRSTGTGEVDGEDVDSAESKRKGRPPREPTPSDAEDQVIDTRATFMDNLASRNIRVGRLSEREKRMRAIDWAEVRQRRREEESKAINTREAQAAVNRILDEAGAAREEAMQLSSGPQLREINGRIELVQDTGTIDRQADADRDIEAMEIVDEDDLTNRITSRSFMKNNKRFPNDFILPGQGKRWTKDDTELFYQGLRMFGSDFAMIATLFPGISRRSIKLKYNREEKEDIERILEAKQNPIQMDWDAYLKVSQQEDNAFADADMVKQQLEEDRQRMEIEIAKAKEEVAERKRQEELAGAMGDGDAGADREHGKGRKKKSKQVAFEDDGVEVLGAIDDDLTWGQEV